MRLGEWEASKTRRYMLAKVEHRESQKNSTLLLDRLVAGRLRNRYLVVKTNSRVGCGNGEREHGRGVEYLIPTKTTIGGDMHVRLNELRCAHKGRLGNKPRARHLSLNRFPLFEPRPTTRIRTLAQINSRASASSHPQSCRKENELLL